MARKRKRGRRKPHKKVRSYCTKCGHYHTRGSHRSHGIGSFWRTHNRKSW